MRSSFPTLALLATLSLGLGLGVQTASSSAMGASGAARAAVSADATQSPAELAGYRDRDRRQWHRYRDRDGRDWRRSHRHRDWSPPRHYRPHSGFYFHFGTPAPRYVPAPRRHYGLSRAHVNWCHARYRSYRAWDNTFQPHYGPRRHCISPYV